uniref:CYP716Y1 n=1 Tax=Bupleurum falcatum TaxID=46367 RepID=W0FW87_BUPFA|nr:CYP716Y1 [Bupleurum falcatum]
MELSITLMLIFSTTIFFIFRNVYNHLISKHKNYPPGSMGLPYIGETLSFARYITKGVPEKFVIERQKKYSTTIFKTSLFGENMVVLGSAEGNKFIFGSEEKYLRVWFPSSVDKVFKKSHKRTSQEEAIRLRKNMVPFLKADLLRSYVPIMDTFMKQHVNSHWNCETLKACPVIKDFTFTLACKLFFSVDNPLELEKLIKLFVNIVNGLLTVPIDLPGTKFRGVIKSVKTIRHALKVLIRQRKVDIREKRATPTQDILSIMLAQAEDENYEMNDEDVANDFLAVLLASYDSANTTLTMIMKYLAEYPEMYDRVFREQMEVAKTKGKDELLNLDDLQKMNYTWNVACEVLRIATPTFGAFREVIADCTYEGYTIPKGWKLYYAPRFTHGSAKYFQDPEKFDPSRFEGDGAPPYTFVPFGGGLRMCPGYKYAKIIVLVFMHNIVTKFKWEKVNPNEKMTVGIVSAPSQGLPLRLHPHKSPS